MQHKQHRLGVVGLGSIFEHQYNALALLSESFLVAGLCDTDRSRQESVYALVSGSDNTKAQVNVFGSVEDMLAFGGVETVLISTPPSTHYDLVRKCLERGKNVILEKPAVLQLAQLIELLQLAEEKS